MTDSSRQSTFEKLVSALLVVGMVAIGWGPQVRAATALPFIDRFLLPITLSIAILALGMLYDAVERFLGQGRGIYAAAIFCSLPATGMVAANPAELSTVAFLFILSIGIWMAVRAKGDDRPFFLAMIGVLLIAAGYFFRGDFRAIAFYCVGGLAAYHLPEAARAKHARRGTLKIYGAAFFLLYVAGALAGEFLKLDVSLPKPIPVPVMPNFWRGILPWLPWTLFLIPALSDLKKYQPRSWQYPALGVFAVLLPLACFPDKNSVIFAAVAVPVLALLLSEQIHADFVQAWTNRRRLLRALPGLLSALLLWALAVLSTTRWSSNPDLQSWQAVAAVLVGSALLWTTLANLPRWSFVLLFAAGVLLGQMVQVHDAFLRQTEPPPPIALSLILFTLALSAGTALVAFLLQKRITRPAHPDCRFLFAGSTLRDYTALLRGDASGTPVEMDADKPALRFAVFGDVTGAESLFSARRGGYFAFRALTKTLAETKPDFAVSLGDLSAHANPGSYRKLRKLLMQIPVPLAVTPGNHDLFDQTVYNASYFHELFGADNGTFRCASVQCIILNNAWGSLADEQFAWLEETLKTSTAPYKLLFCHKPPFDLRDDVFYGMEERPHAERLHELCCAYKVTAVFSGHIHSLLCGNKDGVTYIISGGAGSKLSAAHDEFHYLAAGLESGDLVIRALPLTGSKSTPLLELRFTS
jgi:hypothetical protein